MQIKRDKKMENRGFDLKIENITDSEITLNFWSEAKESVSLGIRDIKFFYETEKCDKEKCLNYGMRVDKCGKQLEFHLEKDCSQYRTMTFIVQNNDTRKEYAVRISLPKGKPTYKEIKWNEYKEYR